MIIASRAQSSAPPAFVFVHGLLGFVSRGIPGFKLHYFRGLKQELQDRGLSCFFSCLPPVGTIAERATILAKQIATIRQNRLYLIGHSMGGMDCRYFISQLDHEHRTCALATLGTPHHGSPLADSFVEGSNLESRIARACMMPGLAELTTTAARSFNDTVQNRPDVQYYSYAGCRPVGEMPLWCRRWARYLEEKAGDNDGQVPITSASWGENCEKFRADHWEMIGWSTALPSGRYERPFRHLPLFHRIVDRLLAVHP